MHNRLRGRRPPFRRRRGFVLLIVLAAIVVSATSLSMLATASMNRSLDAQTAQDDLQRRYAILACERLLLTRAADVFDEQSEQWRTSGRSGPPPAFIRDQIRLGDQTIDLVLADEDAKANLNALYHEAGQSHIERTLGELVGPEIQSILSLNATVRSASRFRRETGGEADDEEDETIYAPAFRTWADVFDVSRLRLATGDDRLLATLATNVTLWGSGRLNIERATDDTVMSVCAAVISEAVAQDLLDQYRDYPQRSVQLLLEKLVADRSDQERLSGLIGSGSSTYSLWTEVASPQFRLQKFSVLHTDVDGRRRSFEFVL